MPRLAPGLSWEDLLARDQVAIGLHDFDADGTPERLVMATAPERCGLFGCTTFLLWSSRGAWRTILTRRMNAGEVRAAPPAVRPARYGLRHGEFAASFSLVDGEPLAFRSVDGVDRDWGIQVVIDEFTRQTSLLNSHIEELDKANVKIAEIDLNGDATPERVVMVDHPAWCDTTGCTSLVLRQIADDDWSVILVGGTAAEGDTYALHETRHGWRRLHTVDTIYTFDDGGAVEAEDVGTGAIRTLADHADTR